MQGVELGILKYTFSINLKIFISCDRFNTHIAIKYYTDTHTGYIWARMRENLSSGFPTKRASKQSPQLQRLSRKLKFCT